MALPTSLLPPSSSMKAPQGETKRVREMELSSIASDDEYIDMEISLSLSLSSPDDRSNSSVSNFEFPMGSTDPRGTSETEYPADELFYKGKLLPLHLPPRLQMVRRLQSPRSRRYQHHHRGREFEFNDEDELEEEETYSLPAVLIMPATAPPTNTSTPLIGSCNISPSESCRVSCELSPEEDDYCFFEWSNELRGFIHRNEKKRFLMNGTKCSMSSAASAALWSKRLKHIKQSRLCQKLKASRAYLRSLFSKAKAAGGGGGSCSGGLGARAPCNVSPGIGEGLGRFEKLPRRAPSEHTDNPGHSYNYKSLSSSVIKRIDKELAESGAISSHRKSFSAATQRHSMDNKPSSNSSTSSSNSSSSSSSGSSSFSFKLNTGVRFELQLLKRSSSLSSELDNSIDGAIAHCKRSHKVLSPQKGTLITSEIASC